MTLLRQDAPTTKSPHFATLLVMAIAPEEIGRRIGQRRKELGWTHRRLADEMHVGERTAQRWQKGRNPKNGKSWLPRLGRLMELADVMKVERSYFVEDAQQDRIGLLLEEVAAVRGEMAALREEIRREKQPRPEEHPRRSEEP